jgi:nitrate/TMAO reductase-like tetraheme cytochrome c subunit
MLSGLIQGGLAWLRGLSLWQALLLLALGAVVLFSVGFIGLRFQRFMEEDPRFCWTCHTMRQAYDQWSTSVHNEVTCHSCHKSDMVGSMRQVWQYVTRLPNEVKTTAHVPASTCLSCHPLQDEEGNPARADTHHTVGEATNCLLCHGQELHRFQAPEWGEICASCH